MSEHSYDPVDGFPQIMPSLRYNDVEAALTYLVSVFDLPEYLRWATPDGVVQHAEVKIGSGYIELSTATDQAPSPQDAGKASSALIVMVEDVDAHHQRSVEAGATILNGLEDKPWGLRQYTALDPEGHRWEFSQQTRRVPPSEWGAQLA